jgi:hypothetical protein
MKEESADVSPIHNVLDRSYFFYLPGVNDMNNQEALECQALTLEPQSGIQTNPGVHAHRHVFDTWSL